MGLVRFPTLGTRQHGHERDWRSTRDGTPVTPDDILGHSPLCDLTSASASVSLSKRPMMDPWRNWPSSSLALLIVFSHVGASVGRAAGVELPWFGSGRSRRRHVDKIKHERDHAEARRFFPAVSRLKISQHDSHLQYSKAWTRFQRHRLVAVVEMPTNLPPA